MTPRSYAMFWCFGEGPRVAGRVELEHGCLALSGTAPSQTVERISFGDLTQVLLERGVLHLQWLGHPTVHIGSLDTPGALRELHDRLTIAKQA